MAKNK
jgi:Holliday junction resolvase